MGADSLRDLADLEGAGAVCASWRRRSSSAARGRLPPRPRTSSISAGWSILLPPERLEAIRAHQVEMPRIDLSSSEIRQRVAAGQSIRYRTPRAVEKYIETHGLYVATG